VEVGLAAAREILGGDGAVLEDLALDEMLVLPIGEERTLQVIVDRVAPDMAELRVCSHRPADDGWTTHARGILRARPADMPALDPARLDESSLGSESRDLEGDAFYAEIEGVGPEFGPAFRQIERITMAPGEALAHIEASEQVRRDQGRFRFHPALLDACLQAAAAALGGFDDLRARGEIYLPLGLKAFRLVASPDASLIVRARAQAAASDEWLCDVFVAGADGRPIAHLTGLRVRRVPRAGTKKRAALGRSSETPTLWGRSCRGPSRRGARGPRCSRRCRRCRLPETSPASST
jgi:acyl transferase domain-containing protein